MAESSVLTLTFKRKTLLAAVKTVARVIARSPTLPILESVEIRTEAHAGLVRVAATDLETTVSVDVEPTGRSPVAGAFAIPGRPLLKLLSKLKGEYVTLEQTSPEEVRVSGKATIRCHNAEEFPTILVQPGQWPVEASFADLLEAVSYAASTDSTRFNLNAVYIERRGDLLRMVSTDGHRLAYADRRHPLAFIDQPILLPSNAVPHILRLLKGKGENLVWIEGAGFSDGRMYLSNGGSHRVAVRLIDGEFPNYRQVIPEAKDLAVRCEVSREEFIDTLDRVEAFANQQKAVRLTVNSGLEIRAENPDLGRYRETLDCVHTGPDVLAGFNGRYLAEAADHLRGSHVVLAMPAPAARTDTPKEEQGPAECLSPVRLMGDGDDDSVAIVMPMRI